MARVDLQHRALTGLALNTHDGTLCASGMIHSTDTTANTPAHLTAHLGAQLCRSPEPPCTHHPGHRGPRALPGLPPGRRPHFGYLDLGRPLANAAACSAGQDVVSATPGDARDVDAPRNEQRDHKLRIPNTSSKMPDAVIT